MNTPTPRESSAGGFAGVVLAGGHSTRMGVDKASLGWNGSTLLEHALSILREAGTENVHVVLRAGQEYPSVGTRPGEIGSGEPGRSRKPEIVRDEGHGPLGGILAALRRVESRFVVVLAVDLPMVRSASVMRIVASAESGARVVGASGNDAFETRQPLLSCWNRELVLPDLEHDWERGERSVMRWLETQPDVRWETFDPTELTNLNDPGDLSALGMAARDLGNLRSP